MRSRLQEAERRARRRSEDERRRRARQVDATAAAGHRRRLDVPLRRRVDGIAGQHERRLDLGDRPRRMLLLEQCGGSSDRRDVDTRADEYAANVHAVALPLRFANFSPDQTSLIAQTL